MAEEIMFCSNCGTELPKEASYCWHCGKSQKNSSDTQIEWEICEIKAVKAMISRSFFDSQKRHYFSAE
ncbi:MAG: zinc-ribbon domain-containing protein, partial [Anaerolineales bacterium]|nr:zinc-ribbon domain-containing protein [Anaerolineales bacterium]